jgi:GalNAc-alpha-(1->4)-GalNAc-alpha-(1->3)-diNAcBac-PP-undecaprenol alpha-1,4-N-acetyl-D-galactosaminyltransferase
MRITTVIGGLTGGGAERVCVNLANAWAERGHRVTILTVAQNSATPAYNIDPRVVRCDIGYPRFANSAELNTSTIAPVLRSLRQTGCPELVVQIALIAMIRRALLATAPDLVVSHLDLTNIRVLAAMAETRVPVIACEHTDTTQVSIGHWQKARAALYPGARVVVASHPTSAKWLADLGATAVAIANPLVAPPPACVERNSNRRRLVALARLSQEKRLDLLIQAFAKIAGDFPEWSLEIYGEGPERVSLARLIVDLVPERIHLCGFVNDPYSILRNADLFVSTSWVEGFGNAVWEALACGIPVVAMECGAAVRTLVRHGVDGLIVRENHRLAPALASLMSDDVRREAFAARAREVLTRFPIEASLQAWDTLLDNVAATASA